MSLRAEVESMSLVLPCRVAGLVATYPPCDWCGSTARTTGEMRRWTPTGRVICASPVLTPCRLAWITGESPQEFRDHQIIKEPTK